MYLSIWSWNWKIRPHSQICAESSHPEEKFISPRAFKATIAHAERPVGNPHQRVLPRDKCWRTVVAGCWQELWSSRSSSSYAVQYKQHVTAAISPRHGQEPPAKLLGNTHCSLAIWGCLEVADWSVDLEVDHGETSDILRERYALLKAESRRISIRRNWKRSVRIRSRRKGTSLQEWPVLT